MVVPYFVIEKILDIPKNKGNLRKRLGLSRNRATFLSIYRIGVSLFPLGIFAGNFRRTATKENQQDSNDPADPESLRLIPTRRGVMAMPSLGRECHYERPRTAGLVMCWTDPWDHRRYFRVSGRPNASACGQ
jgi:hypothetical protein